MTAKTSAASQQKPLSNNGVSNRNVAHVNPATQPPCHTCRRQRLKCDAAKPSCKKCATRGVECLGYGAQPILWVQPRAPGQTHGSKDGEGGESSDAKPKGPGRKRGRPKLVLMAKDTASDDQDVETVSRPRGQQQLQHRPKWVLVNGADGRRQSRAVASYRKAVIPTGLAPMGYHDSRLALSSFDYYNNHMVPDLVLVDSAINPHRADLTYWRYFPDIFVDIIIAGSLTHQLLRCHSTQDSFPSGISDAGNQIVSVNKNRIASVSNPSIVTIYKHQQSTLKALNEMLSDPELKYSDVVLSIVICLMRVEIQQSAFGPWPVHLHAAKTIISRRGGLKAIVGVEEPPMNTVLTNFMLIDIMSAVFTASTSLNQQSTGSQLDYVPFFDSTFKNGRDYDFPCANQLVECIIRINHLRAISQDAMTAPPGLDTSYAQVLYRVASYDPVFSSRSQLRELLSSRSPSSSSSSSSSVSPDLPGADSERSQNPPPLPEVTQSIYGMCEDLARAFQYAVMLYCLRTLYIDRGRSVSLAFSSPLAVALMSEGTAEIDVTRPHESALEGLLEALHRLWDAESKDSAWVGKLTMWPLWVAGMEVDPGVDMAHEQRFICKSLQKLCYYLGGVSPLDAASALQLIWARTALFGGFGQQATWDERVAMPGTPGLFFI